MLDEYKEVVEELKAQNPRFAKIIEKHSELDKKAKDVDEGRLHLSDIELEEIKKEKLKLKDEALALILQYKKEKQEA